MALVVKWNHLQRAHLPRLTQENLESVVHGSLWNKKQPDTLHEALNDILSLTADKVIQLLSSQALIEGYEQNLSDFDDLIGGKEDE